MKVSSLTLLILQINAAIDSGKYQAISISDVHKAIESGSLLNFLKASIGKDLLSSAYEGFEEFYEAAIARIYHGYAGNERRKWGVQNQGLCLVLAWTNEIIQQAFMDADLPA